MMVWSSVTHCARICCSLSVSSETGSHNNAPDLNVNSTYAVTMKLEFSLL